MPQNHSNVIDMPDPRGDGTGKDVTGEQAVTPAPVGSLRRAYEQRPFVGPRKGRRNLYVPQPSAAGSADELVTLRQIDPSNLNAIARTARFTVRVDQMVFEISAQELEDTPQREFDCVLRPAAYSSMAHYIGTYKFLNPDGNHAVWFNSLNEMAHLRELDFEGHRDVNTQHIQIRWALPSGRDIHHYVDIADRHVSTLRLVDVTTMAENSVTKSAVFDLTARTCRQLGWTYEVGLDNISEERQRNLRFLAAFRHELEDAPTDRWFPRPIPATMWALVQAEGGGTRGWQRACSRLWNREIGIDLDRILDDTTVLTDTVATSPRIPWAVTR